MRAATLLLSAATAIVLIGVASWLRRDARAPAPVAPIEGARASEVESTVLVAPEPARDAARLDASVATAEAEPKRHEELAVSAAPPPALEPGGLRVRVVDDTGAPASGIEVALVMHVAGQGQDERGRATTRAPDGRARIGLDALAELRARAGALGVALVFSVAAQVASASPVRTELEGWPVDGSEVELRLPPRGSMRVRLLTREGTPHEDDAQVAWWWVPADVAGADPDCSYDRVPDHLIAAQDGVALIDGIGLDVMLQLSASAPGFGGVSRRGIAGPRVRGEVGEVELRLGPPLVTLRLRVLDPSGRPLTDSKLHAELWRDPDFVPHPNASPARPDWFLLSTDAAGVATFTLGPGSFAVAPRLDVTRRSRDKDVASDEHWSIGSVRFPLVLTEAETCDLGDVLLAPVPVITAGLVVDETGAPVPRASLWFRERPTPEHGWTNLSEPRATTGADGRFLVRGPRLPKWLAVDVTAKGFNSLSAHELEVGAQDVQLVLSRASEVPQTGAVKVHVELEPEVSPLALLLRLEQPRGGGRRPDWWPGRAMQVDGLAPGRYDVWLETRDGGLELTRVEEVNVEAGQVTEDPRLLPLDARGLARTVVLEVVRSDGTPWRRRRLVIDPLEQRADFRIKTDDEGRASFVLPLRVMSLAVALEGQQPTSVALDLALGVQRILLAGE
jgi:hypothetical protein